MLGGDKQNVMQPLARDTQARHIKRLRIHVPIYRVGKELSECIRTDVTQFQECFISIGSCACEIVVISPNINLGGSLPIGKDRQDDYKTQPPSMHLSPNLEGGIRNRNGDL